MVQGPIFSQADRLAISLPAVREVVKEKSIGLLPNVVDPGTYEFYIAQFVSRWDSLCMEAFGDLKAMLSSHLHDLSKSHFERFRSSRLREAVK
jgi:hypothetical protein